VADAFISYSRRDAGFANQLAHALEERGKSVWLDTEDIAPASRWAGEIETAIDSSDAFVFVISPSSIASQECAKELGHALNLSKRVIPVHFGATDPSTVAPDLAELNWVPPVGLFGDNFDQATETLIRAMETDLDWLKSHTRWLTKATEWQQAHEDPSLLVRGSELEAAEQWLSSMSGKQPPPAELHNLFIAASRKASVRRLRRTRAAVSIALAVSIVLAVVALLQRGSAVANAATARSRQLAAEAEEQLSTDPEASLILALEGLRVKQTAEAESALRDALPRMQVVHSLDTGTGLTDAEFNADGSKVVTAGRDGVATIWSVAGERLEVLEPPAPGPLVSATFDPSGQRIVTASEDGEAVMWDLAAARVGRVLREPSGEPLTSATFSPDGDQILTSSADGNSIIWAVSSGRRLLDLANGAAVESAEYSPNGHWVVTAGASGSRVKIWDARTGKVLYTIKAGGPSYDATVETANFSPDGLRVVTADDTGVRVWWWFGQALGQPLVNPATEGFTDARFSSDGSMVVASSADGLARVWDPATGQVLDVLRGHHGAVLSASFSPDAATVLTASSDGSAKLWRAMPIELRLSLVPPNYGGPDNALYIPVVTDCVAFRPDGRVLVTAGQDGILFWDAHTGRFIGRVTSSDEIMAVAYSPDGKWLVAGTADGGVWLVDPSGVVAPRRLFQGSNEPIASVAFSPDGRTVLEAGFDGHARVISVANGQTLVDITGPGLSDFYDAQWSPDGKLIVTAGADGAARMWAATSGRPVAAFPEPGLEALRSAEFSPDGRTVLTSSDDGSARVIDAATGRTLVTIDEPQAAPYYGANFSPNGTMIVTASTDGTTRIWDSSSGAQLEELGVLDVVNSTSITEAVFSPDGKEVATVTNVAGHATDVWSTELAGPLKSLVQIATQRLAIAGQS